MWLFTIRSGALQEFREENIYLYMVFLLGRHSKARRETSSLHNKKNFYCQERLKARNKNTAHFLLTLKLTWSFNEWHANKGIVISKLSLMLSLSLKVGEEENSSPFSLSETSNPWINMNFHGGIAAGNDLLSTNTFSKTCVHKRREKYLLAKLSARLWSMVLTTSYLYRLN